MKRLLHGLWWTFSVIRHLFTVLGIFVCGIAIALWLVFTKRGDKMNDF